MAGGTVDLGAARLDLAHREVTFDDGKRVHLTRREFALLAALNSAGRRVVSRERLHELIFPAARARSLVDTYVYYLRRKLGREAVLTVHGIGYRLGVVRPRESTTTGDPLGDTRK